MADSSDSGGSRPNSRSSTTSSYGGQVERETVDVIRIGQCFQYTIPSFSVITIELRHAVISVWNSSEKKVKHLDIFLRESSDIVSRVPSSIEILESCHVDILEFSTVIDIKGFSTGSSTSVCVIWKWKWMVPEAMPAGTESELTIDKVDNSSDAGNSDPEEDGNALMTQSLVFKCIGCTKSKKYQIALEKARNLMTKGEIVPVRLVHECYNPHDARALAFVCDIQNEQHTVGYVITELLDEVHTTLKENGVLSVKFAWIRYITDWTRSGPGFFAGITITKKGTWSKLAVKLASTR